MKSQRFLLVFLLAATRLIAMDGCPDRVTADDLKKETIGFLSVAGNLCSATLLSAHVLLTAAHCVEGLKPSDVLFSLTPDLGEEKTAPFASAAEIRVYPKYARSHGKEYGGGDVALVRLAHVFYGKHMPVVFYSVDDGDAALTPGATAFVIGYGLNKESPAGYRRSRHVRFKGRHPAVLSDGTAIPAGVFMFARGDDEELPCGGDSGSPILKFVNGKTSIIAVHSASFANATDFKRPLRKSRRKKRELCRITSETYDTAIGPFKSWIQENWAQMETDRPPYRCPQSE